MEQTRRSFLKGAGLVALGAGALTGAAGLTGCAAASTPSAFETKHECDVVVAGAGIGGLAAAVSAAEQGANVVLVEASKHVGGTSRFAAGAFGPRFGAEWEAAYAKAPLSDPELGKFVCDNWSSYLEWIEGLGMTTEELAAGSPYVWI